MPSSFTKQFSVAALGAAMVTFGVVGTAEAARIKSMVWAENTYDQDARYKIDFVGGSSSTFVKSIVFDLRAGTDPNAVFDPAPGAPWGNGPFVRTDPSSPLIGIGTGDITFNIFDNNSKLEISFAGNSFGKGDYFEFWADTDYLGNNSGGAFGDKGVSFTVNWSKNGNLSSNTVTFKKQQGYEADSIADVPEPTALLATLIALGFGVTLHRQGKNKTAFPVRSQS